MRILVTGLPGSGKTTQAKKISEKYNIPMIKMGELLRELAGRADEIGQKVREVVERGDLVDDKFVAELISHKVQDPECQRGFVIDGYPRTVDQLKYYDPDFDFVFYLNITPEESRKRLGQRGRADDTPEVIENRLKIQQRELDGLIAHFKRTGHFLEIHGLLDINHVFGEIEESIDNGET